MPRRKNGEFSSEERPSGKVWWSAVGVALCVAAAVDAFLIEPERLVLEKVDVPIWNLPEAFEGYRIAILADLHYPRWTRPKDIQRAIALANTFEPDLIAIPGDICDKVKGKPASIPNLSGLFDTARAPDGIVGVLGNHDHWFHAESLRQELAKNTPVNLIENTSITIERAGELIAVGGVGDLWDGIVAPERTFAGVPLHVPRILLSHNPDLAEWMREDVRVDIQLSGHTHGGQVCLPFGPALKVPSRYGNRFRAGLVHGKHHRVYIARGVASARHLRFFCPPEVTAVTLRTSRNPQFAPRNMAINEAELTAWKHQGDVHDGSNLAR